MQRQLKARNTITLPKPILTSIHAKPGDYFEIQTDGRQIILIPRVMEDPFDDEEWDKIDRLARQKGKKFSSGKSALQHLRKISKFK